MRVLIFGGRDQDPDAVCGWLEEHFSDLLITHGILKRPADARNVAIIEGGAGGADLGGLLYAIRNHIDHVQERADWIRHGRAAGPIRNQKMIDDHKPDLAIGFPGGVGSADMARRVEKHNIPLVRVQPLAVVEKPPVIRKGL